MKKAEKRKKGKNKKTGVFHSMEEIERTFFPKSVEEKRLSQMEEDPRAFGVNLAMESLQKIAHRLAK